MFNISYTPAATLIFKFMEVQFNFNYQIVNFIVTLHKLNTMYDIKSKVVAK